MLGAYKARVAPFNVNYRYVAEELRYLLDRRRRARRSSTTRRSRPTLAEVRARPARRSTVLLQVADELGQRPAPRRRVVRGRARRGRPPSAPPVDAVARRPLHPLHRRHDRHAEGRAVAAGRHLRRRPGRPAARHRRRVATTSTTIVEDAAQRRRPRCMPAPPFMHGAAPLDGLQRASPAATRSCIHDATRAPRPRRRLVAPSSASRSNILLIVGDAFGRPLLDELDRSDYDLSLAAACSSAAAPRSSADAQGASSSRMLPTHDRHRRPRLVGDRRRRCRTCRGAAPRRRPARSRPAPGTCIVSEDLDQRARAGRRRDRLAGPGGPACRSATSATRTRPPARSRSIDGVRYSVPGDRARLHADGIVELLRPRLGHDQLRRREDLRRGGRARARATTRPSYDVVVRRPARASAGARRSSPIVQLRDGVDADRRADLLERGASSTSPATSCPRRSCFVDEIVRSPVRQGRLPLGAHDRRRLTPSPAFCVATTVSFGGPRDRERQWGRGSPGARPARGRDPRGGHRHAGVGRSPAATRPDRRRAVSGVRAPDVACLPQLQALRRRSDRALMA